ncbi:MAG: hypothetical protein D6808_05740, partial [Candidatus Dadabacteria bacterium]
ILGNRTNNAPQDRQKTKRKYSKDRKGKKIGGSILDDLVTTVSEALSKAEDLLVGSDRAQKEDDLIGNITLPNLAQTETEESYPRKFRDKHTSKRTTGKKHN